MHQSAEDSEGSPVVIALADRHGFGEFFSGPTKRANASDAALDFCEEGQVHTYPEVAFNAFTVESDRALTRGDSGRVKSNTGIARPGFLTQKEKRARQSPLQLVAIAGAAGSGQDHHRLSHRARLCAVIIKLVSSADDC